MKRSQEIEQFMRDLVAALERGDSAFMERTTSRAPGVVSIGSDPNEYARDYERIMSLFNESTPQGPLHIHVRLTEVHGYEQGDVGWADGTGSFDRNGESVETRFTAVLLGQARQGRAVQRHRPIGVPHDAPLDPLFPRPPSA